MLRVFVLPLSEVEKLSDPVIRRFPGRKARADRIRNRDGKLRCLGAGALLLYALEAEEDQIKTDACGKPYLADQTGSFNLSHSGDYVVLARGDGTVGIDTERYSSVRKGVAERCCTAEELDWMRQDEEKRFFQLWTMKESVTKAVGLGLRLPLNRFSVLPLLNGQSVTVEALTLFGRSLELPGHALSVVSTEPFTGTIDPVFLSAEEIERKI